MNAAAHVIVVGRGHGGTRIPAHTLHESGFYMSDHLNESYDLIPGDAMYDAVRHVGRLVRSTGDAGWDFSAVLNSEPSAEYADLVYAYLTPLLGHDTIAWKLPESVLGLPWLVQLFPDAYYIHWVRDGRDNILGEHGTDDLRAYDIPAAHSDNRLVNAALSWKYHLDMVAATPRPRRWLDVRLRDFVLRQPATLKQMSQFLDHELTAIPVNPDAIGRWRERRDELTPALPLLQGHLHTYHYEEN